MADNVELRRATVDDAQAIASIYAPYVRDTAISFEIEPPTSTELASRIERTIARYPYLVAEVDHKVVGYAYAGPLKERAAYASSAELSVYVEKDFHGGGIGRALYEALQRELADQGITNFYACIAYPQQVDEYLDYASVQFHQHMGFSIIGHFHSCAHKFGNVYDMVWMEKLNGAE